MEQLICTTLEQSKKLIDAGIDPHTADMTWHHHDSRIKSMEWELRPFKPRFFEGDAIKMYAKISKFGNDFSKKMGFKRPDYDAKTQFEQLHGKDVPAWSFMGLLKLMPKHVEKDGVRYDLRINWNDDDDALYYVNADRKTLKFERRAAFSITIWVQTEYVTTSSNTIKMISHSVETTAGYFAGLNMFTNCKTPCIYAVLTKI